jgi:hypothetical protein
MIFYFSIIFNLIENLILKNSPLFQIGENLDWNLYFVFVYIWKKVNFEYQNFGYLEFRRILDYQNFNLFRFRRNKKKFEWKKDYLIFNFFKIKRKLTYKISLFRKIIENLNLWFSPKNRFVAKSEYQLLIQRFSPFSILLENLKGRIWLLIFRLYLLQVIVWIPASDSAIFAFFDFTRKSKGQNLTPYFSTLFASSDSLNTSFWFSDFRLFRFYSKI